MLPTLAALAGATLPQDVPLDGEDRSAVLQGPAQPRTKPLFWEWRFNIVGHPWTQSPILAVRSGPWKLLVNPDGSRVELYSISQDPGETDNVADEHSDVVADLRAQVLAWQKSLPPGPYDKRAGSNAYPWPKVSR
jgi:arylsulfatase A-like enzyme